jgi:hypothetical protein
VSTKNTDIEAVGNSLIEHVRGTAASRHGIIDEIFPYARQAAKKISARAICRFLEEEHGVKLSYVTIGRALRQPEKYWNLYVDLNSIEQHLRIVGRTHNKPVKDFMSEPEKFQEMLEGEKVYAVDDILDESAISRAMMDYENAVAVLDAKWFCFDEDILEEARMYLLKRFSEKPAPKDDETEQD